MMFTYKSRETLPYKRLVTATINLCRLITQCQLSLILPCCRSCLVKVFIIFIMNRFPKTGNHMTPSTPYLCKNNTIWCNLQISPPLDSQFSRLGSSVHSYQTKRYPDYQLCCWTPENHLRDSFQTDWGKNEHPCFNTIVLS